MKRRSVSTATWLLVVLSITAVGYVVMRGRRGPRSIAKEIVDAAPAAPEAAGGDSSTTGRMPAVVREGFHRHDKAPEGSLWPGHAPKTGQHVKVHINLYAELESASYPGESTDWFAMGGSVKEVLDANRVLVELVATTDRYPKAFDGAWVGVLEFREGFQFPWVLTTLERETAD